MIPTLPVTERLPLLPKSEETASAKKDPYSPAYRGVLIVAHVVALVALAALVTAGFFGFVAAGSLAGPLSLPITLPVFIGICVASFFAGKKIVRNLSMLTGSIKGRQLMVMESNIQTLRAKLLRDRYEVIAQLQAALRNSNKPSRRRPAVRPAALPTDTAASGRIRRVQRGRRY